MRSRGKPNPEWGYLAPAPSFMRTARIVAVATAIGATAGAGVVLTLAGSGNGGGLQAESGKSLVVVRSLVQPAEAAPTKVPVVAPVTTTTAIASPPAVPPQKATEGLSGPELTAGPVVASVEPSTEINRPPSEAQPANALAASLPSDAQVLAPLPSDSLPESTPAVPTSVAALAEIPAATDVPSTPAATQIIAAPDQTGAAKQGGKPAAQLSATGQSGAVQDPPRVQQPATVAMRRRPEEHGLGPMLRHLFSARAGNWTN